MKSSRQRKERSPEELKEMENNQHKFCVSALAMKVSYSRSADYELCDKDGTYNPTGDFYRSLSTGKVKPIRGQCSLEFLEDGKRDPGWEGCPFSGIKHRVLPEPNEERILALVTDDDEGDDEEEVPAPITETEASEINSGMSRLELAIANYKKVKNGN